jgi:hypothetical protein
MSINQQFNSHSINATKQKDLQRNATKCSESKGFAAQAERDCVESCLESLGESIASYLVDDEGLSCEKFFGGYPLEPCRSRPQGCLRLVVVCVGNSDIYVYTPVFLLTLWQYRGYTISPASRVLQTLIRALITCSMGRLSTPTTNYEYTRLDSNRRSVRVSRSGCCDCGCRSED